MNSYFSLFENWLKERVSALRMKELLDAFDEIENIFIPEGTINGSVFELTDISLLSTIKDRIDNDPGIASKYMIKKFTMSFALEYYIKWVQDLQISEVQKDNTDIEEIQNDESFDSIYYINNDNNYSYAGTHPLYAVYFNIKKIKADTWPELYVKIMSILVKENYSKIMTFNGYGDVYYKSENNSFPSDITPAGIGYNLYVNVNLSIDEIVDKIKKFITICDLDFDDLVIAYTENEKSVAPDISATEVACAENFEYEDSEYEDEFSYNFSDDLYRGNELIKQFEEQETDPEKLTLNSGFDMSDDLNEIFENSSVLSESDEESSDETINEEHILFKTKILNSAVDGVIEVNNRYYTMKKDECSVGDLTFMLSKKIDEAEEHQIARAKDAMYIQDYDSAQSEFNAAYHNREFLHSFIDDLAELRDEMNNAVISMEYKTEKPDNISFDIVESVLSDMLGGQKTILFEEEKSNVDNINKDIIKTAGNNISLVQTWIMKLSSIRDTIDSIENDITAADNIELSSHRISHASAF